MYSPTSKNIHPRYFEWGYKEGAAPRSQLSPPALLNVAQFLALLSISFFCFTRALPVETSADTNREGSAAARPLVSVPLSVETRFQNIAGILDYLLVKASGENYENDSSSQPTRDSESRRVCRVTAAKALLRTGPGKKFPPLMAIGRNTELLVESEEKDWLGVRAPTGESAWVSREVASVLD